MSHKKIQKDKVTTEHHHTITENTEVSFESLVGLFEQAQTAMQSRAARSVDIALVVRNWLFGWYIVEYQQHGTGRADYGKGLLKNLSKILGEKLGKGFSVDSIELMRKFYLGYTKIQQTLPVKSLWLSISETPSRISESNSETVSRKTGIESHFATSLSEIWQTLSAKFSLSWSHYVVLLTIKS